MTWRYNLIILWSVNVDTRSYQRRILYKLQRCVILLLATDTHRNAQASSPALLAVLCSTGHSLVTQRDAGKDDIQHPRLTRTTYSWTHSLAFSLFAPCSALIHARLQRRAHYLSDLSLSYYSLYYLANTLHFYFSLWTVPILSAFTMYLTLSSLTLRRINFRILLSFDRARWWPTNKLVVRGWWTGVMSE